MEFNIKPSSPDNSQMPLNMSLEEQPPYPELSVDSGYYESLDFHKKNLVFIITTSFIFLFALIHIVNWDKYSIEIIPLKIRSVIGASSVQDLHKIARICEEQLKYDCALNALIRVNEKQTTSDTSFQIAELMRKQRMDQNSVSYYKSARDLALNETAPNSTLLSDIYYGLAKSYENLNQTQAAIENYDLAIQAKPEVIQVTVTQAYITLLKKIGRLDIARAVIEEARKRSGSESMFAGMADSP